MSNKYIYIAGKGFTCSIGNNPNELIEFVKSKSGIIFSEEYKSKKNDKPLCLGEISDTYDKFDSLIKSTIDEAINNEIENDRINNYSGKNRSALIIASTSYATKLYEQKVKSEETDRIEDLNYIHPYFFNNLICDYLKFSGLLVNNQNACASSGYSISYGYDLLKNDIVDRVIIIGIDFLCESSIYGFESMGLLDYELVKPYDKNRNGTNLGEGCGVLIIKQYDSKALKNSLIEIKATEQYNDGYHMTSISPDSIGLNKVINELLKVCDSTEIDLVVTHGTGTSNNDLTEGNALKKCFKEKNIDFTSFKSAMAHTLGASSILDVILSVICMENNFIIPTFRFNEPIKEHGLTPVNKCKEKEIRNVITLSSGMGGYTSGILLSK